MSAVTLICPNLKCRKVLKVPEEYRGKHVRCHHCGTTFCVPGGSSREKPPLPNEDRV